MMYDTSSGSYAIGGVDANSSIPDWYCDGTQQLLHGVGRQSMTGVDVEYADLLNRVSSTGDNDLFQSMVSGYGTLIEALGDCRERSYTWPGRPHPATAHGSGNCNGMWADLLSSTPSTSTESELREAGMPMQASYCGSVGGQPVVDAAAPGSASWSAVGEVQAADGGSGTAKVKHQAGVGGGASAAAMAASRRNAWGNLSYAELITQAIESSPEKRMTLSQIYDWMVKNVPYFSDKGDSYSSAGWKNSIRHNLSLHSRFMRVANDTAGKSSWWIINHDAKQLKTSRRRAASMDTKTFEKKRGRAKKKVEQMRQNAGVTEVDSTTTTPPGSEFGSSPSDRASFGHASSCGTHSLGGSASQLDLFRTRAGSNASSMAGGSRLSPIEAALEDHHRNHSNASGPSSSSSLAAAVEPMQLSPVSGSGEWMCGESGECNSTADFDGMDVRQREMASQQHLLYASAIDNRCCPTDEGELTRCLIASSGSLLGGSGGQERTLSESLADMLVSGNFGDITSLKRDFDAATASMMATTMTSQHLLNELQFGDPFDDIVSLYAPSGHFLSAPSTSGGGSVGCNEYYSRDAYPYRGSHNDGSFEDLTVDAATKHQQLMTSRYGININSSRATDDYGDVTAIQFNGAQRRCSDSIVMKLGRSQAATSPNNNVREHQIRSAAAADVPVISQDGCRQCDSSVSRHSAGQQAAHRSVVTAPVPIPNITFWPPEVCHRRGAGDLRSSGEMRNVCQHGIYPCYICLGSTSWTTSVCPPTYAEHRSGCDDGERPVLNGGGQIHLENGAALQTINQVTCNRQVNLQPRPQNYGVGQSAGQQQRQMLGGSPACGRFQQTQAGIDLVRPDYRELSLNRTPAVAASMLNMEAGGSTSLASGWLDVDVEECLSSGATSSSSPRNSMPFGQTDSACRMATDRDLDERQNSSFGDNLMATSGAPTAAAEADDTDAVGVDQNMISFVDSFDFCMDNKM